MTTFTIGETDFLLDGRPHQVISGTLHYFRIHPEHWADRIRTAKAMGLNTIETYVAWNAHEPVRGEWDATGWNDLGRFLDLIAAEGLHAIVRPGPYICAEWHNGGLPVWLTSTPGIGIRRSEPQFVEAVSEYLRRVYEIVAPRQIDRGGNVVLVQIENEYGAYGSDKEYLRELVRVTKDAGITVPLTTVDQPMPWMLEAGSLPELHLTGSFGSRSAERLATLREHQPTGPLMCSEFWDGWFDWWGSIHHTTDPAASAHDLDVLLAAGASVNIYMVHGGTNFGTTNGANDKGRFDPIVTSYDYDAPIDESGHPTAKFHAFREVIAKYAPVSGDVPPARPAAPAFEAALTAEGDWMPSAQDAEPTDAPRTFEQLGHLGALVRYDVDLPALPDDRAVLAAAEVRDLAWIEVDGVPVGRLSRSLNERALAIPTGTRLTVVVEDQGRVNYADRLGEAKGLIGPVTLNGSPLTGWLSTPVDVTAVTGAGGDGIGRAAFRGSFDLDAPADLFLDTSAWGKGYAFVNGFFLGRYWRTTPQNTLYVPGPATRAGANEIVVLELEQVGETVARFVAEPSLGQLEE
ncbi:beta-galactosidase [Microbacterium testaceum StLB037]|uniref:Beta-galactosidase n=1 Tax=Microbacterium testaceum (strain StLB037) TaxID=979556 RepID=E8NDZ8_MICTS|nr:beta-galactosidase family protein [Microbacterium testaceum]BAJ75043.1 beta-galactosidase [Microbacterium testaceum StLB037]